jgi:hypothetical protein
VRGADAVWLLALGSLLLVLGLVARGPLRATFLVLGVALLIAGYLFARRRR